MTKKSQTVVCLIDGQYGIHIPKLFARDHYPHLWGIQQEDVDILLAGSQHENYWDVWNHVLETALRPDDVDDTHSWTLYQNGDLLAIRDDYEFEE